MYVTVHSNLMNRLRKKTITHELHKFPHLRTSISDSGPLEPVLERKFHAESELRQFRHPKAKHQGKINSENQFASTLFDLSRRFVTHSWVLRHVMQCIAVYRTVGECSGLNGTDNLRAAAWRAAVDGRSRSVPTNRLRLRLPRALYAKMLID